MVTNSRAEADDEMTRAELLDRIAELTERIDRMAELSAFDREECDLYRVILDMLPAPVWRAKPSGKCDYFNKSWLAFTGRRLDQELGDGWADGVHPDDSERLTLAYTQSVREWTSFRLEYRLRRYDGNYRHVIDVGTAYSDPGGKRVCLIGSIFDITDRDHIQQELENASSQAQLYLDLMSHDINNLNQVGMGYLEVALNTLNLNAVDRELLEKSLEALHSSSALIDNVRKLQKFRSGELRRHEVNLCEILDEMASRYSNIRDRDVRILYVSKPCCLVSANALIRDVFINLITNSIKHTPENRSLEIEIRAEMVRGGGKDYCKIYIEDNGPGIPDEIKPRLFGRFQRGKTEAPGRGLGLYLVKTLVDDFGGRVWVEDRVPEDPSQGARFVVMLPSAD